MRVGFTYDLRDDYLAKGFSPEEAAEFDTIQTIEGIESALVSFGLSVDRIGNIESLTKRLAQLPGGQGGFRGGVPWDFVFNIAEGLSGFAREAQIPALLEAYHIPYTFSDPLALSLCLHKGMTKRIVRDLGLSTPGFAVFSSPDDPLPEGLDYPLFAKPVAEGTGKGISGSSRIESRSELRKAAETILLKYRQPVLIEEYLPGREYTVGIVGTGLDARSTGIMEIHFGDRAESEVYSFTNKKEYEERVTYSVPRDESASSAVSLALAVWRGLGLRDGGRIDIREDRDGLPSFIEVNPLAGLNPVDSDLPILSRMNGMSYTRLIYEIVESAAYRVEGLSDFLLKRGADKKTLS
jgi:D-alanine-D-alanine ligase